jgi:hypothetical protein
MCNLVTGEDATAESTEGSHLQLSTGKNAVVTCTGGSTCQLALGAGAVVECGGQSSCAVTCPDGTCEMECDGTSECFCTGKGCLVHCPSAVQRCGDIQVCASMACPAPPA